ncbi:hypothetical protein KO353_13570 [Elioraea tepida]|uniref:PepSY domain-containing protein n=1 Tax=Elioraea tepida TaxID=2843330 RepID=A0A975U114_9PROT|nr:hypothetical protein [Elioraea tepida]QXM24270.1 hypothetical protein KO353_13570 [Elioraea tepida]
MHRRLLLAGLMLALPARAQPLLPLPEAVRRVEARYLGRMIEAEVVPGRYHEMTPVVYELRWLTPRGDVLRIRVSAVDGALLDVNGQGMLEARRP